MLLAQIDYERLIGNVGVPAVFMLAIGYVLIKFAPKIVAAHLDFLEAAKHQGQECLKLQLRHAESLDAVLALVADKMDTQGHARYRDHLFSTVRTNEALGHFADIVELMVKDSSHESQIALHVQAIRSILADNPPRRSAAEKSTPTRSSMSRSK